MRCKKEILYSKTGVWGKRQQCSRNVWPEWPDDGFCRQHHPETVEDRDRKSRQRYEEREKNSPLVKAWDRIRKLEAELEELRKMKP